MSGPRETGLTYQGMAYHNSYNDIFGGMIPGIVFHSITFDPICYCPFDLPVNYRFSINPVSFSFEWFSSLRAVLFEESYADSIMFRWDDSVFFCFPCIRYPNV